MRREERTAGTAKVLRYRVPKPGQTASDSEDDMSHDSKVRASSPQSKTVAESVARENGRPVALSRFTVSDKRGEIVKVGHPIGVVKETELLQTGDVEVVQRQRKINPLQKPSTTQTQATEEYGLGKRRDKEEPTKHDNRDNNKSEGGSSDEDADDDSEESQNNKNSNKIGRAVFIRPEYREEKQDEEQFRKEQEAKIQQSIKERNRLFVIESKK